MQVMEAVDTAQPGSAAAPSSSWLTIETRRYGYRVGGFSLLVGAGVRSEVVRAPSISTIPHSPSWLLGLINLRGNLVPVADLRVACGEPSDPRAPATVLVLGAGEEAVAMAVDALPQLLNGLRPLDAMPLLPAPLAACAGPAFADEEGAWCAFDHEEFFRALARGAGAHS